MKTRFARDRRAKLLEGHAFDLVDGNGDALAPGESFWAALTLGKGSVTRTLGSKANVPQKPTLPVSEPFLRWIRIEHDASGLPVIDLGNLEGETVYDRFHFQPGSGLSGSSPGDLTAEDVPASGRRSAKSGRFALETLRTRSPEVP